MVITNLFKKIVTSGVIVSALIGGASLAPLLVAQAAQTNPPVVSSGDSSQAAKPDAEKGLARILKVELRIQDRQGNRLDGTSKVVSRVEQLIDKATAAGKDVGALRTALDAYKDAVSKAKGIHEAAGDILKAHAGFTDGKVTDKDAARTTVTTAGAKQKEFAETLKQAHTALKDALKDWKQANTK